MRRPLIAAAAAAVALALMPATSVAEDSAGGTDITPPAVGSCHALTFDEGWKSSDPDPAVSCDEPHTSITIKVAQLEPGDFDNVQARTRKVYVPCWRAVETFFDDGWKATQLSAYTWYWFQPTKAQMEAGASWIRCDLVLDGGTKFMPLPTTGDPQLGSLPHGASVARCRLGEKKNYLLTACSRPHAYKATHAVKHPGARYPGSRKLAEWTVKRCRARLGQRFGFYSWPSPADWRAGRRYSICEKG